MEPAKLPALDLVWRHLTVYASTDDEGQSLSMMKQLHAHAPESCPLIRHACKTRHELHKSAILPAAWDLVRASRNVTATLPLSEIRQKAAGIALGSRQL